MGKFSIVVPDDVEENEGSLRIDNFLTNNFPEFTRSYLKKLITEDFIYVNGLTVKPSYNVKPGDEISGTIPDPKDIEIKAVDIPLDILYEDDDVIVINKPKGMVIHPASGHYDDTLVNALMFHCRDHLSGINGDLRPGIVHRIDKDTTGSIIACKTNAAHISISKQLKDHTIKRKYLAIVRGNFENNEGTIDKPIGRDPNNRIKMAVNYKNGKDAVTHYRVIEQFKDFAYIECVLETGRTHQIRVHMADAGHPLLGDPLYGGRGSDFSLQGQTLHAMTLGFVHPRTNEYIEINAPLPDYFKELLENLRSL